MKAYPAKDIRNVCLLGHGGDGKTSLAESLLFMTRATDRLGKIPDGNTVADFDPEEIKRKITITSSIIPVEFNDHKMNFIDTPGYFDFAGEVYQALRVADTAVIVCTAKNGVGVGTELAWKRAARRGIPKMIYISKID
ncbi:MAG: GTP-binding protein, partial [Clostridia bacterium]